MDALPAEDQDRRSVLIIRLADEAGLGRQSVALHLFGRLNRDAELAQADFAALLPLIEKKAPAVAVAVLEKLDKRELAGAEGLAALARLYESQGEPGKAKPVLERFFRQTQTRLGRCMSWQRWGGGRKTTNQC